MEKRIFAVVLVLAIMLLGVLSTPAHAGISASPSSQGGGRMAAPALVHHPVAAQVVVPKTTFPRTVLVETFTGVWCHFCPAESQALYNIDRNVSHSVLNIAELHSCAFAPGSGPCLENYVPPDGTTTNRASFYNVCGYPDVFFDGIHDVCGAIYSTYVTTKAAYERSIANASMFPGNVSIVQDASVSGGNAVAHVNITSGINGSYNAITYLLELINKQNVSNGYGPHDLAYVVRETLRNHPVSLVAGASTLYDATGRLNSTWNDKNLSVVTFVQQNSTKNVENANMAPVITLTTSVASNQSTVLSGSNSTITVRIANSSTGAPVPGAVVYLTSSDGSPISPATGVTASDGTFSANFSAPTVSSSETVLITAQVTAAGYTAGSGSTSILVNPVVLPAAASGLTVGPGNQQVSLNWTSPSSGGSGLSYHVYRSDSPTGTFTAVGLSTSTGFVDTGLVGGLSYWYKVSAQNSYGFSPNTTAIPATSVSAASQGLPTSVGWWISIDSMNFSSTTNATLSLFLPSGLFGYQFGPHSYAFLASEATSPVVAAGVPLSITASFTPRYASLQGTVSPSNAAVTLNGVAVSVVNGAFVKLLEAGTYSLNVTAAGYTSNVSTVTMTPGNITPAHVLLQPVQSGNGGASGSNAGLTGNEMIAIIGLAVVGVVAVIAGLIALSRKGKRNQSQ